MLGVIYFQIIPPDLSYPLMKAALRLTRDRSIEVLLANWPHTVLSLTKLAPPLFSDLAMRYNTSHLHEMVRRAVKLTTCLAHTFVECLKKRTATKLQCLDLTGYPAGNYIPRRKSGIYWIQVRRAAAVEISLCTR